MKHDTLRSSQAPTDHHRARMTKEVLDIKLAGIDPNRPGSKSVAVAVGVDLANPSPQAVTSEHNVHVMIAKGPVSLMVIGRRGW